MVVVVWGLVVGVQGRVVVVVEGVLTRHDERRGS